ncbi:CBS domain-containing protein [Undibacterium luofuense]|uniref:CBS domain-containing protein n=1 Tax=Undibacterium luofuense TaxID=2828733 RepID=UPI0030ED44D1
MRSHADGETVTARPSETLADVYRKMRRHDISQLPVIEGKDTLVGVIDEWDVLNAVRISHAQFAQPVRSVMTTDLLTLAPDDSLEDLLSLFRKDKTAPVVQNGRFLGLITQTDVLNYWQRQN